MVGFVNFLDDGQWNGDGDGDGDAAIFDEMMAVSPQFDCVLALCIIFFSFFIFYFIKTMVKKLAIFDHFLSKMTKFHHFK